MNRKEKRAFKIIQAMNPKDQVKSIQAMNIEGINFDVAMSSLLDGVAISSIGGTANDYRNYSAQVTETYRKYNGESEFGNTQVKTIVDTRTAFISGEGLSVILPADASVGHKKLFQKFKELNKLDSNRLFDLTKMTEMSGYAIATIIPTKEKLEYIPIFGIVPNNSGKHLYTPTIKYPYHTSLIKEFSRKKGEDVVKLDVSNFIYFRTGGDGISYTKLTTKVGSVLNECESYDRALKDMRLNNYYCARITPTFQTKSAGETKALTEWLQKVKWKIGQAFSGTAKLTYETPGTGAHENLQAEMVANLKTMSGMTDIPAHWFGWIDLISNKATASEMYAAVNNGTIMERNVITSGMKEAFIEMQLKHIDSGGTLITEAITDFEVKLPLIDFGRFESMVKAYSMLYADDVVSLETYRNIVPGIDPILEAELIAKQEEPEEEVNKTDIDILTDEEKEKEEV